MTTAIPYLSEETLDKLQINARETIEILEALISGNEEGTVWSAPKAVISPPDGRYIMATLAVMSNPPLVATKSLVLNDRNVAAGLPQINSLVTVLNGETGIPLATIDGNWITAIRTAGLTAVAAKYLANGDAKSAGFIGSGVQARSHLKLFSQMFPLARIKVFGRGQRNIDALCRYAETLGLPSQVCVTAKETVQNVDIVVSSVTHTAVSGPFLDADWLAPGCFAASVELGVAWHKDSFSRLDRLFIDDLKQEETLPNKLAHPEDVDGDLAELITDKTSGRTDTCDRTAFVFRGHALGDLALSALAYRKYQGALENREPGSK